jgi:DNA-binding transcriptional ArsR family regulator
VTTYGAVLEALGDPTRRSIVERLGRGPSSVGDLADDLPVSRPAVSQHLKVLKDAGLVSDHAEGTRRIYRIRPDGFQPLRTYVEAMWTDALGRFKAAAEREGGAGMEMTTMEPVVVSVTVARPVDEAFSLFTERFEEWWPMATHSIGVDDEGVGVTPVGGGIEPRLGGRIFERLPDGRELPWGEVRVWDPPARLVLSWAPGLDPRPFTEVDVRFVAEGSSTRVELTHRGWELLGEQAMAARSGYLAGWPVVLARFVEFTNLD